MNYRSCAFGLKIDLFLQEEVTLFAIFLYRPKIGTSLETRRQRSLKKWHQKRLLKIFCGQEEQQLQPGELQRPGGSRRAVQLGGCRVLHGGGLAARPLLQHNGPRQQQQILEAPKMQFQLNFSVRSAVIIINSLFHFHRFLLIATCSVVL